MNAVFGVSESSDWRSWFTVAHEQNILLPLPSDWVASSEPWVMIHEGRLHPVVIAAAARIHGVLKAAGLLSLDLDAPLPAASETAPAVAPVP